MNWKLRFKNKATLTAIIAAAIALIYQIAGLVGAVPAVSQSDMIDVIGMIINLLVLLGIVVDPTTAGISDSEQAQDYDDPAPATKTAKG